MDNNELIERAIQAREKAYAPYSKYRVGAAVLTVEGKIFSGCNVENCSYPLGNCAEKVAICKAVSEGFTKFQKIAIATGNPGLSAPCGSCRQVMREFHSNLEIIVANPNKKSKTYFLKDILPFSFGPDELKTGQD